MTTLLERLKKNSRIKETSILNESKIYSEAKYYNTPFPLLNAALTGDAELGFSSGLGVLAGPSKHFKTGFALVLAKAFLDSDPEAAILFYDSEFGSPPDYFQAMGVDMSRVMHTPVMNVEELKFDIMSQLEIFDKKDKVMIIIDSIGNLASKKEVEDAKDAKSVADMSRAKQIKSLFRIVTPYLKKLDIPMMAINHTYKEQGLYPKDVVSGGTGIYYSADWIWILGRRQEKKGTEIKGYHFVINIEKSRMVKEKSKLPISISFDHGIMKYSGLLEIALNGNYIAKPSIGWYSVVDRTTGEIEEKKYRETDIINNEEVWVKIFKDTDFLDYINGLFALNPKNGKKSTEIFEVDAE